MKLKTTAKKISQEAYRIAKIGYCDAQNLLKYRSPFAYSSGVYGWNADYYEVNGVVIATGYRGMPKSQNTSCSYETVRRFDSLAENETEKEKIEKILDDFIKEITK